MKRRPRRMLLLSGLLLLAWGAGGAIINVAVAWGCAYAAHPGNLAFEDRVPAAGDWRVWKSAPNSLSCFDEAPDYATTATAFGVTIFVVARGGPDDAAGAKYLQVVSGWPCAACAGQAWLCQTPPAGIKSGLLATSRNYRDEGILLRTGVRLPYSPLWPGFAVNTILYALMLRGLFAVPFALRRRRRVKRGLCPMCAYPVGASEVCTECGAAVAGN